MTSRMPTTQAITEPVFAEGSREALANAAARAWLAMVDKGQYAESWSSSSALFQGAITSDNWVASLQGARAPLGKATSRKLASATYTRSIPGGPANDDYVVIHYTTSFANAAAPMSDETVTAVKDTDGQWRVAGYSIK